MRSLSDGMLSTVNCRLSTPTTDLHAPARVVGQRIGPLGHDALSLRGGASLVVDHVDLHDQPLLLQLPRLDEERGDAEVFADAGHAVDGTEPLGEGAAASGRGAAVGEEDLILDLEAALGEAVGAE